jgi:hypothetical protein
MTFCRRARSVVRVAGRAAALAVAWAAAAQAQSFTLDDSPAAPAVGAVGPIPGCGAENPYGLVVGACPTGLAPSPTLALLLPLRGSGSILGPGPVVRLSPNGHSLDALSSNHAGLTAPVFQLRFSVDRLSDGQPGSGVAIQVGLAQQPGDLYAAGRAFADPATFIGLGSGPFAGVLPAATYGAASNTLRVDESAFGLRAGGAVVGPSAAAPPIGVATHDNLDSYDDADFDADGDGLFDAFAYFSINPDEATLVGRSPADLFDVAPGTAASAPLPFAAAGALGLDSSGAGSDSIDALVVFDHDTPGGPANGGPGAQPGTDYALFSLAPGSASLAAFGLSAGDVLFTDFSGAFAVYAAAGELGLAGVAGGAPGAGDNVDALELRPALGVPALPRLGPAVLTLALAGAVWRHLRRGER